MSLIFLAASVGSASDLKERGCTPSPSAIQSHSAEQSSQNTGLASLVTTTFAPSPQADWLLTEFPLMSSAEGFPAKTSARQEKERD